MLNVVLLVSKALLMFLQSFFSLFFRLDNFYLSINLLSSAIPEELTDIAASLEEHGEAPRADDIVADVICRYRELCSMDRAEVIVRYKSYMRLLGGKITVKQTGEELTALDVTNSGELVAKRSDGSTVILNSGEISICK